MKSSAFVANVVHKLSMHGYSTNDKRPVQNDIHLVINSPLFNIKIYNSNPYINSTEKSARYTTRQLCSCANQSGDCNCGRYHGGDLRLLHSRCARGVVLKGACK